MTDPALVLATVHSTLHNGITAEEFLLELALRGYEVVPLGVEETHSVATSLMLKAREAGIAVDPSLVLDALLGDLPQGDVDALVLDR